MLPYRNTDQALLSDHAIASIGRALDVEVLRLASPCITAARIVVELETDRGPRVLTVFRTHDGIARARTYRAVEDLNRLNRLCSCPPILAIDESDTIFPHGYVAMEALALPTAAEQIYRRGLSEKRLAGSLGLALRALHQQSQPGFGLMMGPSVDCQAYVAGLVRSATATARRLLESICIPVFFEGVIDKYAKLLLRFGEGVEPALVNGGTRVGAILVDGDERLILTDWSHARRDWPVVDYAIMAIDIDTSGCCGGRSMGDASSFREFMKSSGLPVAEFARHYGLMRAVRFFMHLGRFDALTAEGDVGELRRQAIMFAGSYSERWP
jgi:hypothetical protein